MTQLSLWLLLPGMVAVPPVGPNELPKLVFSVRTWEGEYASKDIPGGVASTPVVGAIYTIGSDGGQPKKVVELGKNTDYPAFHPDGRWIYFQSNATGHSNIYRCRPDGSGIINLT